MHQPGPAPKSGKRVELVAPSGPVPLDRMSEGMLALQSMGLEPTVNPQVILVDGYLAGSDQDRLNALSAALRNPDNAVVWAARGGYGVARLLALGLDASLPANPPTVVGFSDISLLLAHLAARGWPCIHGPNVTTLPDLNDADRTSLVALIHANTFTPISGLQPLNPGVATGPICPMNWTVLCSVAGTPLSPPMEGRILLLEDIHESAYRLDRNMVQLSQTPWFSTLAGLVIGDLGGAETDPQLMRTIRDAARHHHLPCATNAPVGHGQRLHPIPVGRVVTLDTMAGTLS